MPQRASAPEARVRRAATREATAVKSLSPATREELPLAATRKSASSNTDPAQPKIKKLLFFKRIDRKMDRVVWLVLHSSFALNQRLAVADGGCQHDSGSVTAT